MAVVGVLGALGLAIGGASEILDSDAWYRHVDVEHLAMLAQLTIAVVALVVLIVARDRPWAPRARRVLVWLFAIGGVLVLLAIAFVLFVLIRCLMGPVPRL
jgi:RsiW-degrading membrane proteinase PrsW (M82 family)